MYYVYHIMEKIYRGRYGIDHWFLCEQEDLNAAQAYAHDASKSLMKKYNSIESKLRKEAHQEAISTGRNFDAILEELYNTSTYYEIYEVDVEQFANETMMYREFIDRRNHFISNFCKQVV